MSRRSTRLLSGGYYNSDEESDSSSVTISYRENPVKVFKKSRKRRGAAEDSPDGSSGKAETTQGAPSLSRSALTRPALKSPASVLVSPPQSPPSPLSSPTRTRPVQDSQLPGESALSAVDSSGYSSSDDHCRQTSGGTSTSSRGTCCSGTVRAGPRVLTGEWLSGAVSRLKDAVTTAVAEVMEAVQSSSSRVLQLGRSRLPHMSVTGYLPSSARMKTLLCGLLLLLILIGVWWTSLLSGLKIRTGPALTAPVQAGPPVLKASALTAAVEEKMQHIQREIYLRHDRLVTELKQQMRLDVQALTQRSLQQEEREQTEAQVERILAEVQSSLQALQERDSTTAKLLLRISALEDQVSRMEPRVDPPPAILLTPELEQAMGRWLSLRLQAAAQTWGCGTCDRPLADKMADFALESQGASVVSTRCSETYRTRSACVTLFGLPLWYPSESPRTVIQGPAVLLPGKCWAFHGVQGSLVIALSHPIHISHVTLDHLPRHSSPTGQIQSAPKDFQVYGMTNETEEGALLGTFRYQEDGEPTQTFSLSGLSDAVYRVVELRVLSNWGHVQYTCVYRFRVHGQMSFREDLHATAA